MLLLVVVFGVLVFLFVFFWWGFVVFCVLVFGLCFCTLQNISDRILEFFRGNGESTCGNRDSKELESKFLGSTMDVLILVNNLNSSEQRIS